MEKAQDLRITKTHMALCKSFLEALREKRFEEITVGELCDRAMVRRATFYKHFADKYEFFVFFVNRIQKQFEAESIPLQTDKNPKVYCLTMTRKLIDFLVSNEDVVGCIMKSNMLPTLLELLSEQIVNTLKARLKESAAFGYTLPASPDILAAFYVGGLVQILRDWLAQKSRQPEKALIAEIEKLFLTLDCKLEVTL